MIDVSIAFRAPAGNIGSNILAGAAAFALKRAGVRTAVISLVIMDDAGIHEVNRTFLGHDYPTDVITFPLEDSPLEAEICIGADAARRQAREYGVPVTEEMVRLAVHGALHAAGYDDRRESDRKRMTEMQERCVRDYLRTHRKKR